MASYLLMHKDIPVAELELDTVSSVYRHYLNCCGRLEIPGVQEALDRMMVLDYLIVNEDRH